MGDDSSQGNTLNNVNNPTPPTPPAPSTSEIDLNATNRAPIQDLSIQPTDTDPVSKPTNKKIKKSTIAIICFAVAIIIGLGVFITLLIIGNQPQNIVASALNKLLSSEHITIDGNINFSANSLGASLDIDLNSKSSKSGNSSTVTAQINLPGLGLTSPITLTFDEIVIKHGTIYLKAGGVSDMISAYSNIADNYYMNSDNSFMDVALEIAEFIENRWIKISYDELLNGADQNIAKAYNCAINTVDNIPNYSDELADLYKKYPFLNMEQAEDSFYSIFFNTNGLTGYLNSIPSTKIFKDTSTCLGYTDSSTSEISENDLSDINRNLPQILAKFEKEGLFSHKLTEVKITNNDRYYSINSDIKFDYSDNGTISEPTGDIVSIQDIMNLPILQTSLQKSQYDAQRRDDIARIYTALLQYQSNNRFLLPSAGEWDGDVNSPCENDCLNAKNFIMNYLNPADASDNDFKDPNGNVYQISIASATTDFVSSPVEFDGKIYVDTNARCIGSGPVYSDSARDFAIVYYLEDSGTYCRDNF